jgi:hypothetical protein
MITWQISPNIVAATYFRGTIMKTSMVIAVVTLFFVQSGLCLAAPVVLAPVPDFPIQTDIGEFVANSPFFRLSTGDFTPFETHSANTSSGIPQDIKTSSTRVPGSPLCQFVQEVITGERKDRSKSEVLSWAGLVYLSGRTSQTNKYAPMTSTYKTTRLNKLTGQPFPLKEGNVFSLETSYENVLTYLKTPDKPENVKKMPMVSQTTCHVGATKSASMVQASLKGSATALDCTVTNQGGAEGRQVSYYWLDSVGCFVRP